MKKSADREAADHGKLQPILEAITTNSVGSRAHKEPRNGQKKGGKGKPITPSGMLLAKIRLCGSEAVLPPTIKVTIRIPLDPDFIASLASQLAPKTGECDENIMVKKAIKIFQAAHSGIQANNLELDLLTGVFELDEAAWEKEIDLYPGDLRLLAERYEEVVFKTDFVLKQLFLCKAETERSRQKKFLELAQFAQRNGPRRFSKTGESLEVSREQAEAWLEAGRIDVLSCRWLVVARQRQMAQIKAKAGRQRVNRES